MNPRHVTPPDPHPLALGVQDAARTIGISRSSLYRLVSAGELQTIRLGRRTLVAHRDLSALVERLRVNREVQP